MAFIDIKDPAKRQQIVQDYIETRKALKVKSENEKALGLDQQEALQLQYNPIIQATKDSAKEIAREIKLNRTTTESVPEVWKKGFMKAPFEYYSPLQNRDRYFGINRDGSAYTIGNHKIDIDSKNNISLNGKNYEGTPGVWELLMLNKPENYSEEDLSNYREIATQTDLYNNPKMENSSQRPKTTSKYTKFLQKWETEGQGIILPGDIMGLVERLKLVCAEREAGNIDSTTSEIVAILDELLRKNHITRKEYNVVCKKLSC